MASRGQKNYLVGEVARGTYIEDDNDSSVFATIMNPSVDGRLKREEKIEKILNEAAALTALVRERSLEKCAAQLQREELAERRVVFFIEEKKRIIN